MPVIVMPMKNARGKSRCGFVVSSTMFTESSKPMIAKNASAAPLTTSENGSPPALNSSARAGSPTPWLKRPSADEDDDQEPRELDARHRRR